MASEAGPSADRNLRVDPRINPRLAAALAGSMALHALVIGAVDAPPPGGSGYQTLIRASLMPVSRAEIGPVRAPEFDSPLRDAVSLPPTSVDATNGEDARASLEGAPLSTASNASAKAASFHYLTAQELDSPARPLGLQTRPLTEKSLLLGRLVTVRLRLYIADTGKVDRYEVLHADGLTDAVSLEDVQDFRFSPALRGGRPVASQKTIELTFSP